MVMNQISTKPRNAERQHAPSAMVKVYFVGYGMYAAVGGNPGVIVSKQTPYNYPGLGDYIEVSRRVGEDLVAKSRWSGMETLVLEENGGGQTAKLVKQYYISLIEKYGLESPEFQKEIKYKRGMIKEEFERQVAEQKEFQSQVLEQFYTELSQAKIDSIIFQKKAKEMTDEAVRELAESRGLLEMTDEELLAQLAVRGLTSSNKPEDVVEVKEEVKSASSRKSTKKKEETK